MPEPIQLRAVKQRSLEIDRDAGTIRGVSVISQGEAEGHGFIIDSTMLDQVASKMGSGVKVRLGHPGILTDGTGTLIGRMVNAKRDGSRVRADLSLPDYAAHVPGRGDVRAYLMDVAETHPDSIGVSIAFEPADFEEQDGERLGRVRRVLAADIVDEPAANRNGLLTKLKGNHHMIEVDDTPKPPQDSNGDPIFPKRDRATEILAMAKLREEELGLDWAYKHIKRGSTIEQARKDGMAIMAEARPPIPVGPSAVSVGAEPADTLRGAIVDHLAQRIGGKLEKAHPRAADFRGMRFSDLAKVWLHQGGASTVGMSASQLVDAAMGRRRVQLAHSTSDFADVLADAMNKAAMVAYRLAPRTWDQWARQGTAPDFRNIRRVKLSDVPTPVHRVEGAEVQFVTLSDAGETYTLKEYANGLRITRQALVNDDLSAFDAVPSAMVTSCRQIEDDVAYAVLTGNANMADGNPLFDASNHNNVATGTGIGGVPTVDTLGETRKLLRKQTGPGGNYLDLTPWAMIVPAELETTAEQLISSLVDPSSSNDTPNLRFVRQLRLVSTARLDATSTAQWYIVANPAAIDTVEVSFLADEQAPVVTQETDFDTDDLKIKCRHTVAAKALDWRGMVRNNGS